MKISIILPCFNVEKYIEFGLNSIIRQTYKCWEAILINDGSTDNTGKICEDYATRDKRFKVIHTVNRGVSAARNRGLQMAKGAYIFFMDPDDTIIEDALEKVIYYAEKNDVDAIRFNYKAVDGTGRETWNMNGNKVGTFNRDNIIYTLLPSYIGSSSSSIALYGKPSFWEKREFGTVWRFLYKKEVLTECNILFDNSLKLNEDSVFNCRFLCYAKRIVFINDILYVYHIRNQGALATQIQDFPKLVTQKKELVRARSEIRDLLIKLENIDIRTWYSGSLLLSATELTIKGSGQLKNWRHISNYLNEEEVKYAISKCQAPSIFHRIGVITYIFKWKLGILIFMFLWCANKIGIKTTNIS